MQNPELSTDLALLCRIGALVCALPAAHVVETMRPLPIEPLAGMPPFVAGLSVVRGVPTPIVDAARLLGIAEGRPPSRFIAIRVGTRQAILAVDAVLGVQSVARASLSDLPPLLREAGGDVVEGLGTLDAELLLVLKSARIVPSSVWAALDGEGART